MASSPIPTLCAAGAGPLAPARVGRLAPRSAFLLQASLTVSYLASSSAPTPLYPLYQAQWGFSPTMVAVVFGIYAIAVLAALLVVGRLSDHVGRRPVLLASLGLQLVAMLVFTLAGGLADLLVARVLQGLATGAAMAAVGAGLMDLDKARGATANAIAPPMGTALGGVLGGLMVQFLPAPAHTVYAVFAALFALQAIGVWRMAETAALRPGALASLRPQLAVPASLRGPLLLAIPALVAGWALAGFYGALGPALLKGMLGSGVALLSGLALFVLAGFAAAAVLALQRAAPRSMLAVGAGALLAGVGLALLAATRHAPLAFFAATALAGVGFGAAFQGAVRSVVTLAAPHERAGVLAVVFVVSYLAMGVPAVAAGYWVAHGADILGTARGFGEGVMLLAGLALLGTVSARRESMPRIG